MPQHTFGALLQIQRDRVCVLPTRAFSVLTCRGQSEPKQPLYCIMKTYQLPSVTCMPAGFTRPAKQTQIIVLGQHSSSFLVCDLPCANRLPQQIHVTDCGNQHYETHVLSYQSAQNADDSFSFISCNLSADEYTTGRKRHALAACCHACA